MKTNRMHKGSIRMCIFLSTVIYCYSEQLIRQIHYCFATTYKPLLSTFTPEGVLMDSFSMICNFKEQRAYNSLCLTFLSFKEDYQPLQAKGHWNGNSLPENVVSESQRFIIPKLYPFFKTVM